MKIKDLISTIENLNIKEALEYLVKKAENKDKKTFVVTLNSEIIMLAREDSNYQNVLKSADLALADGIGVIWAGKLFGKSFKGRVHGSDLTEKLSEAVSKQPITVGFLGGRANVAEITAERLRKKYSGLKVSFAVEEWSSDVRGPVSLHPRPTSSAASHPAGARRGPPALATPQFINHQSSITNHKMSADILFVAFGSPKQEKWIYENLPKLDVTVAIGVGGSFDFISGKVKRAPVFIRNLGLEWLFRLIIQPWRVKRQIALLEFVILVLKEKLGY